MNLGAFTVVMAVARKTGSADECAFMLLGKLVEHTRTEEMFVTPQHQQTADYIEGRYG
jgi:phosphate transport system ATP-binding protein